jgi:hypothetical protein
MPDPLSMPLPRGPARLEMDQDKTILSKQEPGQCRASPSQAALGNQGDAPWLAWP